jgi:hypothetical protein
MNTTIVIVATTTLLVALSIISPAFAQSSDPGALGEILGDSPPGQKIASGDSEPGQELRHLGCTSQFASGERSNNPHCPDEDEDDE